MSLSKLAFVAVFLLGVAFLAVPLQGYGQTNYYGPNGTEYSMVGSLPGDQVFPDMALTPAGGFVVWQDNATDGSGWGISAQRLDSTFSGTLSAFRVNVQGTNNQQYPRVAMLKNGGAAFVWQGGASGKQQIFARFLTPTNTWLTTTDVVVSTLAGGFQIGPALTVLNNSNVVIVWSSFDQAGSNSLMDVYGKILSPTGQTVSNSFLINKFTSYNQRDPAVAALTNGGFAVVWISEQEVTAAPNVGSNSVYQAALAVARPSADVYGRLFTSNGVGVTNEFMVDSGGYPCSSPVIAPAASGGFLVAWCARNMANPTNGWDVYARSYSAAGAGGAVDQVNTYLYGDQYNPRVSSIGNDFLVAWTSLAQDGSREGVYGQVVHSDGTLVGYEFRVNTTTPGQQMQPSVASDGSAWFDVVWTGFSGVVSGFDLFAQRYANVAAILQPMSAPFVYVPFNLISNKYSPQLEVSWPLVAGVSIASYQVYVDGSATAITNVSSATNEWVMGAANGLTASSTHAFQLGYLTSDGRMPPLSPATSGTTWSGANYYGIPFEWMEAYYGLNFATWPANVNAPLAPGGLSLYSVFLSGGNPLDPTTWLKTHLAKTSQGMFLNWNTQPGLTYQVQQSVNLKTWSSLGSPRFAAGTNDSVYTGTGAAAYYRVVLVR